MLTYGLGRGLEAYDYCTIEDIRCAAAITANEYRIHKRHLSESSGKHGIPKIGGVARIIVGTSRVTEWIIECFVDEIAALFVSLRER